LRFFSKHKPSLLSPPKHKPSLWFRTVRDGLRALILQSRIKAESELDNVGSVRNLAHRSGLGW
jgi:hypothetical protein